MPEKAEKQLKLKVEALERANSVLKTELKESREKTRKINQTLEEYNEALTKIAGGDTSVSVNETSELKALSVMGRRINKTAHTLEEIAENSQLLTSGLTEKLENLQSIAAGDLTTTANEESPNDKLVLFGKTINAVVKRVTRFLKDVRASAFAIEGSSAEILTATDELASGLAEEASSLHETTATFDELSATAGEISKSAAEVKEYAKNTLESTNEGNQQVEESVDSMLEIEEASKKSARIISTLSEKSQAISEVIAIINNIAKQTNLLALNASIEASRAGEAGKGFAVVAGEVGKLAENVKDSAGNIEELINEIQDLTTSSILTMEEVGKKISNGKDKTQKISKKLNTILKMVQATTQLSMEITFATHQQKTATEQATKAVEEVKGVSRDASKSAQHTTTAADDLSKLALELKEHINRFMIS